MYWTQGISNLLTNWLIFWLVWTLISHWRACNIDTTLTDLKIIQYGSSFKNKTGPLPSTCLNELYWTQGISNLLTNWLIFWLVWTLISHWRTSNFDTTLADYNIIQYGSSLKNKSGSLPSTCLNELYLMWHKVFLTLLTNWLIFWLVWTLISHWRTCSFDTTLADYNIIQ